MFTDNHLYAQNQAMQAIYFSLVFFVATFAGVLFGMHLAERIPTRYLQEDSRQSINLGIGLVATMTALILGLITASTKTSFDLMESSLKQSAVQILTLDRTLAQYGPETQHIRAGWKGAIGHALRTDKIRNTTEEKIAEGKFFSEVESLADQVRKLRPRDENQRKLYARAMELSDQMLQSRWFIVTGIGSSIPLPFLGILLFWLTLTFIGFGLISPRNRLVIVMYFLSALSTASAIFLILELDGAFDGLIFVGTDPLEFAYKLLNHQVY